MKNLRSFILLSIASFALLTACNDTYDAYGGAGGAECGNCRYCACIPGDKCIDRKKGICEVVLSDCRDDEE